MNVLPPRAYAALAIGLAVIAATAGGVRAQSDSAAAEADALALRGTANDANAAPDATVQEGEPASDRPRAAVKGEPQAVASATNQPQDGAPRNGQPQNGALQDDQPQDGQAQDSQSRNSQPRDIGLRSGDPLTGKLRPLVHQYGPKRVVVRPALPALKPYRTAPEALRRARLRASDDAAAPPDPAPTVAALPPPEPRKRPAVDPEPFAPLGVDVGTLRMKPYVETDVGYDTNPQQVSTGGKASSFVHVEGGTSVQSQWANHSLSANLRAGYDDYFQNHPADRPFAAALLDGRIDVARDLTIDLEGRLNIQTQSPYSPAVVNSGVATAANGRPLIETYGGSAGVTKTFNRLALTLRGSVDRTDEENAQLPGGGVLDLAREDYTAYELRGRAAYTLKPGLVPFVEVFGDTRQHDAARDLSGYARDSVGDGGTVGTAFEITSKLTGDVSGGYEDRAYADRRLADLRGPLVDGRLLWSATPLTTVTFHASTAFSETDLPGSSGAVVHTASLELSHALLRNLTLTGTASYQNTDYSGVSLKQDLYDLTFKADYNLTRSIVVRGSFTHERLASSTGGEDYTQNIFLLGLRLQR